MRRVVVIGAVMLAAAGLVLALSPFSRPGADTIFSYTPVGGSTITPSSRCSPPVVSAFRHEPPASGWFGYAPVDGTVLTPAPLPDGPVSLGTDCRQRGANRLALALTLEVAAGALVLVRRRPRPTATAPTVAPA